MEILEISNDGIVTLTPQIIKDMGLQTGDPLLLFCDDGYLLIQKIDIGKLKNEIKRIVNKYSTASS
ncbi:hypothetical protein J4419_00330 [Candidatus Woesearchaeota archaeon]|nr:hypothetical protein [Candidatus Woesearchaeota archaeon]